MWTLIDKEMTLKECSVYKYCEDPFDGEDGSIWTLNYFFFNKARKRVAYIHVRGVPVMTYSPRTGLPKRSAAGMDSGANKRAKYWLGDRAADAVVEEDDDYGMEPGTWSLNDEVDPDFADGEQYGDDYDDEADDESELSLYNHRGSVRGMSEEFVGAMEID